MLKYIDFTAVRAKLGNRSRSAIYVDLAAKRLPLPVKIGGKLYWSEKELDSHLSAMRETVA